jgi:hypothetical protein
VEDEKVENDDVERRKKMMILRRIIDPKTGIHPCYAFGKITRYAEPAQAYSQES